MKYYAYLSKDSYCEAIAQLNSEVQLKENMVVIENYSLNYLNRKYDITNKKWTDEYLQEPIKELNTIEKQDIINAQILNKLEYIECLAELNSMKGGNL